MDLLLRYRMSRSTRSRLNISASLCFLQYWCVCWYINDGIRVIFIVYTYINYVFAGYFLHVSLSLVVERGTTDPWGKKLMDIKQVSQGIHPEVHSQRIWGPKSPDPPAFAYLAEAWVMVVYFIYPHNGHISKSVTFAIKVFHHRRFLRFPMCDVEAMAIDPAM